MSFTGVKVCLVLGLTAVIQCRSFGQTVEAIRSLETSHKNCLDKGQNMLRCTTVFYIQIDSMLNLAYANLRKQLTDSGKEQLKADDREWIKKKDVYFKKHVHEIEVMINAKKSEWGEVGYGALYLDEADFLKERAIVLINRLNKEKPVSKK